MILERVDIRVKIIAFIAIMVALFVFTHPLANTLLVVGLFGFLLACRTPLGGLWRMLQPLLVVFVLIVAVTLFTSSQYTDPANARVLFSIGALDATLGGLLVGLNFVARIILMVLATYAFTISTPVDDLLMVMAKLRAPYWLSILVTTALSFVPTMARKSDLIVEAQRARGARVRNRGPIGQIIGFVPLMVPLITNSILLADNLAVAMTNRGYGASKSMTQMRDLRLQIHDWLVLAATVAGVGIVIWLRYGQGYGVI